MRRGLVSKLDALRQRQGVRVVHRDRLPPHVGLPRVAAALAAAAGLLLAAENYTPGNNERREGCREPVGDELTFPAGLAPMR